jgi:hypothetical protein
VILAMMADIRYNLKNESHIDIPRAKTAEVILIF